ncbi:Zn(II)2Cys6 transcription factor [Aspergillus ellipticus CBS 707.79]|uniref:Zn(II)2Cys6 transcription factor n=1 Tax=Aspergillus ellipticus CBS 707.79 TaxID=1448320 RepID=A0A319DA41_9EURO|nr:Zn(II)2Cys6 transcription factor [Aspergillus ellipticus CBS 707.79]
MDPSRAGRPATRARGKYTTKACEECRRRRAKCDGLRPSCSRCLRWRVSCQYSGAEDGRRPAPKSYVLLLRQRIESLEKLLERHGINHTAEPETHNDGQTLSNTDNDQPHGATSAMDSLCENLKGRLSLDESLNFDQDGEMRYFGPTSGRLPFQEHSQGCQKLESRGQEVPELDPAFDNIDDYIDFPVSSPSIDDNVISVDLQDQLVDLYFTWEQPWYQIVDERLFRENLISQGRYWTPLLHYSILALGSRYSDSLEVRSDQKDPNTAGQPFFKQPKALLHEEMEHPTLTTIQALGVIGMFYFAIGKDAAGWLHHGMADRLCLDMGLNMDPAGFNGSVNISPREVRLRRQIYWTLYCHDKLSATYTGRICSMLDRQGVVSLPCGIDESQTTETATYRLIQGVKLQRAMIELCKIKEKILLAFWAPKHDLKEPEKAPFLKSCLLDLRTWFYDLPPELRIDRPNDLPHAYTLQMIYHTARILLAKPFVMRSDDVRTKKDETAEIALSVCRDSAKAICLVEQKYRRTFGTFHRSPISAMHCTLSAAWVILEEPDCPSKRTQLHMCLTVLDELSKSWYPVRHIAHNLRRLCPYLPTQVPHEASDSLGLDFAITSDTDTESFDFTPGGGHPEFHFPSAAGLAPWPQLPADYEYFDILNQLT